MKEVVVTRFLALSIDHANKRIEHLGVESGGRTRRHQDVNLLKPGPAGRADCADWTVTQRSARSVSVVLNHVGRHGLQLALDPGVAPPSVWGHPVHWPSPVAVQRRSTSPLRPKSVKAAFSLPVVIHFPDYGTLRISSDEEAVCREVLKPDPAYGGLNLGVKNRGHHNAAVAFHKGEAVLTILPVDAKALTLTLTVDPEHAPKLPGVSWTHPRWAGLTRCWQNAFALHPPTLTMGDNLYLSGLAHLAMHFKSDMALFTPDLFPGLSVWPFFRQALEATFRHCMSSAGELNWVYAGTTPETEPSQASFFDSTPSVLVAMRNYLAATGDGDFAWTHLPAILKAADFLLRLDTDQDGILESPFHGNQFEETRTRNWWDNYSFGHKDAYFNLLCQRAFEGVAEILEALGCPEKGLAVQAHLALFRKRFNKVFYNPVTGVHAGWISRDGRVHDPMFTFISAQAINQGLVPMATARRIMKHLLQELDKAGYGVCTYGIPGNLRPADPKDHINWAVLSDWGRYENGGLCGQTAYHVIQALYETGLREEADRILFTMLETFEREPTHSGLFPGYGKSVDWRTKEGLPCGYNYLADNYYFLLAAVTGHLALRLPGLDCNRTEAKKIVTSGGRKQ